MKTGDAFGSWTLTGRSRPSGKSLLRECVCSCGTRRYIKPDALTEGRTKSCGCAGLKGTHHMRNTATYVCWQQAKKRCQCEDDKDYASYGGRGIRFCRRWGKFENFLADMGVKPKGMTLGRIDNDGPYAPSNCEWQTLKQQARNKRNTVYLTVRGVRKPLVQWAEENGLQHGTVRARLRAGWSHEEATQAARR